MLNFTKILSCFIYNMIWNCKNITKYGGFDFARVWNKFSRMASFNGQNILIHYTRGDLSSAPLKLSTTGIFTSKPLHAYILYLISEPIHACWIGSEILHNPSLSALLMNGTPRLGRPSLCAAEVWRYGSHLSALKSAINSSKTSNLSLLSVCIGMGALLQATKVLFTKHKY